MVSIVAGAGLGLAQTSARTLGSGGIFGTPTQGFLGSNYLVNASNGNVIIQNQDEVLTGIGQDVILTRTYNSLGLSNDDNGDNWRESVQRNVSGLTGTVNTAGSTISRTDFDGSLAVYTYDAARGAYVFRNPAGDIDTLAYSSASNRWTWTGGASRVVEVYDNANSGRILSSTDADGKALSFAYTGANLTRVTDSNGEYVALSWNGNNLAQLSTYKSDGSLLVSRVRYGYDTANRLTSVTVDLTPSDNSVSDNNTVTYSYTYDGTSNRVASISETGSNALVAFQYDATTHKVIKVTETAASGDVRVTSLDYATANHTRVTDAQGNVTDYGWDTGGRLTSVTYPTGQSFGYAWDVATGKLSSVTDALGYTTLYSYDANGNLIRVLDPAGGQVDRAYDAANNLLTETHYQTPDPDGSGPATASGAMTTRYVYNAQNHLRFVISAQGQVTEYRYNAAGQQVASINWTANTYDVSSLASGAAPSEATMAGWVSGIANAGTVERTDFTYDFRGNLATSTAWTATDAAGNGLTSATSTVTTFVYDQYGLLLSKQISGRTGALVYTYDGLGRMLTATDMAGTMTTNVYDAVDRVTSVIYQSGEVKSLFYSAFGELLSTSTSMKGGFDPAYYLEHNGDVAAANVDPLWHYDTYGWKEGRNPNALFNTSWYLSQNSDVAASGQNPFDQFLQSGWKEGRSPAPGVSVAQYLAAFGLTALNGTLVSQSSQTQYFKYDSLGQLRSTIDAGLAQDYTFYDTVGRKVGYMDRLGNLTELRYDNDNRLIASIHYTTPLSASARSSLFNANGNPLNVSLASVRPASANADAWTFNIYDAAGRVVQSIATVGGNSGAPQGQVRTYSYDGEGKLTKTTVSSNLLSANIMAQYKLNAPNAYNLIPNASLDNGLTYWTQWAGDGVAFKQQPAVVNDAQGNKLVSTTFQANASNLSAGLLTDIDTPVQAGQALTISQLVHGSGAVGEIRVYVEFWTATDNLGGTFVGSASSGLANGVTIAGVINTVPAGVTRLRVITWAFASSPNSDASFSVGKASVGTISNLTGPLNLLPNPQLNDSLYWDQYGPDGITFFQRPAVTVDDQGNKSITTSFETNSLNTSGAIVADTRLNVVAGQDLAISTKVSGSGALGSITVYVEFWGDNGWLGNAWVGVASSNFANGVTVSGIARNIPTGTAFVRLIAWGSASAVNTPVTMSLSKSSVESIPASTVDNSAYLLPFIQIRNFSATPLASAADRVTRNFYDNAGELIGVLDADGALSRTIYDGAGRVIETVRYATLTAASLRATGSFADLLANVTASANAADRHQYFAYDGQGNLRFTLDANLRPTEMVYDAAGAAIRTVSYAGPIAAAASYTLSYIQGQISSLGLATNAATRTSRLVYDGAGRKAFEINAEGAVVGYVYDNLGQLVKVTRYAGTLTAGGDQTLAQMQSWAGSNGNTATDRITRTVYDGLGRAVYDIDPVGFITEYQYDQKNRVVKDIRYPTALAVGDGVTQASLAAQIGGVPAGAAIQTYAYDANGNRTQVTDPEGIVTAYVYDAFGNVTRATNVTSGSATGFVYDAAGRVVQKTTAYGSSAAATVTYAYDGVGNLIATTDPRGNITTYTYDALGHLLTQKAPLTVDPSTQVVTYAVTSRQYDAFGNVVVTTDPLGNTSWTYYDKLDRAIWQVDAEGYATQTQYSIGNAVTNVRRLVVRASGTGSATVLPMFTIGAGDAVTTFTLDKLDRVTSTTDAEGYTESYGLNAFGERVTVTNKLGGVTTNFFSRRGLLTQETLSVGSTRSDGTVASANIVNTYQYDANSNLIKKIEAVGLAEQRTTIYAYDLDNRLIAKTGDAVTTVDGWSMAQTQGVAVVERYKYDANGNLIEKDDANGNQTLNWYDAGNRKIAELSPLGQLATWTYDANGNVTSTRVYGDLPNGSRPAAGGAAPSAVNAANFRETDYGYDANNRLITTTVIGNGSGVAVAQYQGTNFTSATKAITTTLQYDADGNVIAQTDGNGGKIYSWYDRLGQKIAQVDQSLYMTRWTFDQEGNVTAETRYAMPVTGVITAGGNPPAINLMANSDFSRGIDQWLIGYNPNGILKTGSPYTITNVNGTGTNTIKADFSATAAGQTLSLASVLNTPVVAGDHLAVQIGVEGQGNGIVGSQQLSVWFYDVNGNTVSGATVATLNGPQAYNTKLGGFVDVPQGAVSMRLELYMTTAGAGQGTFLIAQPMVASVARSQTRLPDFSATTGAVAGLTDARTTLFTYDRNGRRLTETRLNVKTASVSGQSVSEATVSATVSYTYNGLGLVTSKREATGDTTSYSYDNAGRQTSITGPAFTDYTGASVSNLQQMSYDGLGNVTRSVENGSRVTQYSYGAEGRLASSTDPLGNVTSYAYDAGGRISATISWLARSDGSGQYVARALKYDAAGHEISENTFTSGDGSSWTLNQSATDYFYDAYGEVIARGTNSGRDISKAQEFNDYDAVGRVWRTNFGNGVTKAYLYDANGNATVLLQSLGAINLKTGGSYAGAADAQAMLGDSGISKTFSVYDARNQLTDTIQSTSNNAGSSVINATQSSTGPQGTVYFDSNADVNGSNRYSTGVGGTYTSSNGALGATRQGQVYASGSFSKVNYNGKPLGIYNVYETITWSNLPIHGGGNITFTNVYYPHNSFTVPAGNGSGSYAVSYSTNAGSFSAAQAYEIRQTLPSGASIVLGGVDASFFEEEELFQAWGEPTYFSPLLQIPNETASTSVMRLLFRAQGSSGPYTVVNMNPLIRTDGNIEPGMFTYDLAQAPFNGLAANSSWDIRYLAFDSNGALTDAKNGNLNVDGSGTPSVNLSQTPVGGPGQALAIWNGPDYTLLFAGLPSGTQHLHVYYRLAGSGGAFTSLDVNPQVDGGAYGQTRWWFWRPPADGQTYEYWVQPEGDGNMLPGARSYGTFNSNSGPGGLTQYAPASEVVHFNPPSGASVTSQRMRYFVNGTWSDWISYGAGGQWSFNAGSLAPDFYSNYSYPIQYETYNGSTLVSQATATLTLGYAGQGISNYNNLQGIPAQVVLNPKQGGGSTIKLYWRDAGSTGAYTPVTLTRNASGAYNWDVDAQGVRPSSGTRHIEYYYDVYDSGGNRLNTLTGSDHVQGYIDISSDHYAGIGDTEIRWNINTANGSQYLVHRQQSYDAFGDIVSETDGRGNVTRLVYNTEGKLIRKIAPQVSVTDEAGNTSLTNPTEYYYYDVSGRQVAQKDANGNLTTQLLLAGTGYDGAQAKATATYLPGSTSTNGYDVWGDLRKVTDGLGNVTANVYDANHNLVEVDHAQRSGGNSNGIQLKDYYAYDVMGQRIRHWTSQYGSGVVEMTDYDVMGRVIKTVTMAGVEADYAYVWYPGIDPSGGYAHISTNALGDFGGWQTVTSTSAGVTKLQNSDIFGNVTWRQDFGGHAYGYTYDLAGHLVNQANSVGQNITYTYYENGYVKSINDNTLHMLSTFQYDNDGNRTLETYNSTNASGVTDGASVFYQNATITYDAMNRIVEFKDPKADITYKYDAVGNRRNVHSVYVDGTGNSLIPPQDYWYKYDGQNRFIVTMGVLANGTIAAGSTGVALTYDGAGNRATATYGYDGHTERYSYTADGYLEKTWSTPAGKGEALIASRTSDALGRVIQYTEYSVTSGAATLSRSSSYDADNRAISDTTNSVSNSVTTTTVQTYDYKAWNASTGSYSGADQGVVTHIHAAQSQSGSSTTITTETAYNYVWWDDAKQSSIRINASDPSNPNSGSWAPGVSSISYDVNGHTTQLVDNTAVGGAMTTTYRNDAYGQVLVREQSQNGVTGVRQQYYYFDGKRIGDVGNNGPSASQVDYVQQLAQAESSKQSGMYRYGKPVASADFDENYQPINAGYPAATAGTYTINTGDTLQSIASSLWGDSSLWYLLADANGIGMGTQLAAGQRLIVPNKVANFHNNTSTFKVYNPGEAIGDTLPTLPNEPAPPPARHGGCGVLGSILMVAVAVAVTVVTSGAGLALASGQSLGTGISAVLGSVASGELVAGGLAAGLVGVAEAAGALALGAAVGSAVSQGVGIATGNQSRFSWGQVGLSAISAFLGPVPVGSIGGSVVAGRIVGAALTNAMTQGIGIGIGLQSSFDWGGVAAAGVGAGLFKDIGKTSIGKLGGPIATNVASSLVASAAESLVSGRDFGDTINANMPGIIANTIGNMVAGKIASIGASGRAASASVDQLKQAVVGNGDLSADQAAALASVREAVKYAARHPDSGDARAAANAAVSGFLDSNGASGAVADFRQSIGGGSMMAADGDIVVTGHRNYWAGSTIDGAGIWVGEQARNIKNATGEFVAAHPGVGVALSVANIGLTIAGGPARYVAGMALDHFKSSVSGFLADQLSGSDWSLEKAQAGGEGFVLAGGIVLSGAGGLAGAARLLPGEGNVGTYSDLIAAGAKGDNITPHHIPSANRMALEGVSRGDGIAINMEQPVPGVGGRHRSTFTYGTTADIDMTPRAALAAGVWDARQIYRADGLYTPQIRSSLQDVIRMNKTNFPTIFVK